MARTIDGGGGGEKNGEHKKEEEEEEGIGGFWMSSEQPKHAGAGMAQALLNVGAGVAGGVGTLLAAPVIGARDEGATGFVKGLGAGVLGAVALPVAGVLSACKSLAEGVANTPAAVKACVEGKEWDAEANEWKWYDLRAECEEVLRPGAEAKFTERRRQREEKRRRRRRRQLLEEEGGQRREDDQEASSASVVDTTLYDALGVSPSASDAAIKKAYYKQALRYHPDKNRGDEDAQATFQKIGQAYQVLSNPVARRTYDERGMQSEVESHATMDAATFFAMVFGSEAFETYVGELRLASTMKKSLSAGSSENDADIDADELQFEQRRRVVRLAQILADDVLEPYVSGEADVVAFRAVVGDRAKDLVGTPFGATLMRVIARAYDVAGERRLAKASYSDDLFLALRDTAHVASTKFDVVVDAARAVSRTRAAQVAEEHCARVRGAAVPAFDEEDEDEPLPSRAFMIVVDKTPLPWEIMSFAHEIQARVLWKNLSYQHAAVLFARKNDAWDPVLEYGSPSSVEGIEATVANARSTRDLNAANAAELVSKSSHAKMMTAVIEAAWRLSVVDIESTLRAATYKLLADHSVDEKTLLARAEALRIVADVFDRSVDASAHTESWQDQLARQIVTPPAHHDARDDDDDDHHQDDDP
ncbi:hypothetical protein CTAYLR_003554 [Chrysophaeum taylorii]|uniref:J domain-containing protein n=1 Tax=Chrysophaeum taylorii TaxID=2483200 RepID=A0AAD7ULN0_9STRA|nr:hypothetical protein CTAYLR_003554 [Chrysophaeum taylorii]